MTAKYFLSVASDAIDAMDNMERILLSTVKNAILELQKNAGYIRFDDRTGYPEYYSHYRGKSEPISAIKVDENSNRILVFDLLCVGDDEVGDMLQDDSFWFDPEEDGSLSYRKLIDILNAYEALRD